MTERAYLHKDFADLTEEDLQEMLEDLKEEEAEATRLEDQINELQEKQEEVEESFATVTVQAAIASILKEIQPEAIVKTFDAIIQALKEYGEVRGKTAHEFFQDPDLPEILQRIQDRAIDLLREYATKSDTLVKLPSVKYKNGETFKVSTDKLTTTFFGIGAPTRRNLARGLIKGQITFEQLRQGGNAVKYERDGDAELSVFYDFLPDTKTLKKYGIPEDFTDFDFFVMTIIDNLYAEGNDIVTVTKVCKEMGLKDKGGKQIKRVMLSLMKGLSTIVTMNVTDLKREWGINISEEKDSLIVAPAIPVMIDAEQYNINGRYSDGCIKITDFSPFYRISAAISGGRFSTWPKEILRIYAGSRTKRYYSVMRYLLREIGWMRAPHSTRSNKLTYSDIYNHTGDKSPREKQSTDDMLHELLHDVFMPAGIITEYTLTKKGDPGLLITLADKKNLTDSQANKKKLPPPKK